VLFERKTIPVQVFGVLRGDSIFYLQEHLTAPPALAITSAAANGTPDFGLNPYRTDIHKTLEDNL
jgi:hypothetical protein